MSYFKWLHITWFIEEYVYLEKLEIVNTFSAFFYIFKLFFFLIWPQNVTIKFTVRPGFVDTFFIVRLRPNTSMRSAVITNY